MTKLQLAQNPHLQIKKNQFNRGSAQKNIDIYEVCEEAKRTERFILLNFALRIK